MPKLWADTIQSHREQVRVAVLDVVDELVASQGLLGITMSQLASATGIGRPTLYKYFGDVQDVLTAWHHRHVAGHLAALREAADGSEEPAGRLSLVLETLGWICRERSQHGADSVVAALHGGDQADSYETQLRELLVSVLRDATAAGVVRNDLPLEELAAFCVHALAAAGEGDMAATARLVDVVRSGLAVPAAGA